MDNTEAFDNLVNYLIEKEYCNDVDGAYGIIENSSDAMIMHLAELAPLAAIPAIAGKAASVGKVASMAGKAASVAGKAGKVAGAAQTASDVGKKAMKAVSPHSGGESAPVSTAESLELVCDYLLDEGFADTAGEAENIYDHMSDLWKNKIIENRQMAYSAGESEGKKSMKSSPAKVTGGKTYTMKGKDGKPLFKEGMAMDDAIVSYLMHHGYANNPVSAEIVLKHMSETWLNDVANEINESLDN